MAISLPAGFLERIRKDAKQSQAALGDEADLSESTIKRAEATNQVSSATAEALGSYYSQHYGFVIDLTDFRTVAVFNDRLLKGHGLAKLKDKQIIGRDWPVITSPGLMISRRVVGRSKNILTMREVLDASAAKGIQPVLFLKGIAGSGKSTLARYYAFQFSHLFKGVWWIGAQKRDEIVNSLCDLAQVLGIEQKTQDRASLAKSAVVALQTEVNPWLLIYDNAESFRDFREFLPVSNSIRIVITTRRGDWPPEWDEILVSNLGIDDAVELLNQECRATDYEIADAVKLVTALDRMPLALVCAGAWMRETKGTASEYLEKLTQLVDFHSKSVLDYEESIFSSIQLLIQSLPYEASFFLRLICWISSQNIRSEWFSRIESAEIDSDHSWVSSVEELPESFRILSGDIRSVERAFFDLERYSLLEHRPEGGFKTHRLVQMVQRILIGDAENEYLFTASVVVASRYPLRNLPAFLESWDKCRLLNSHVFALKDF